MKNVPVACVQKVLGHHGERHDRWNIDDVGNFRASFVRVS